MKTKFLAIMVLAGALFGAGCVSGSVSDEEICVTRHNVEFPGAPVPGFPVTMEQTFPLELGPQLDKLTGGAASTDGSEIFVTRVVLTAVSGVTDFAFLDGFSATLYPSETSAKTDQVTLVSYAREAGDPAASPLELAADATANLYEYVKSGTAAVTLEVTGTVPDTTWTIDATVCFSVKVEAKPSL